MTYLFFKYADNTRLYPGKNLPTISAEERDLIPLVRYQMYYNKKKQEYCSKYYQNKKI
jgi:hypothetical protein